MFWDSLKFFEIFHSPQVKRWAIITYKHGIYELSHELPNDLRVSILGKSLLNRLLGVLARSPAWRAYALACSCAWHAYALPRSRACILRASVLTCLARLRAWLACMHVLCLRASYDACLACLPLTYSRFCLIIYFVCINQGFAIKRKLLIHVNLS